MQLMFAVASPSHPLPVQAAQKAAQSDIPTGSGQVTIPVPIAGPPFPPPPVPLEEPPLLFTAPPLLFTAPPLLFTAPPLLFTAPPELLFGVPPEALPPIALFTAPPTPEALPPIALFTAPPTPDEALPPVIPALPPAAELEPPALLPRIDVRAGSLEQAGIETAASVTANPEPIKNFVRIVMGGWVTYIGTASQLQLGLYAAGITQPLSVLSDQVFSREIRTP